MGANETDPLDSLLDDEEAAAAESEAQRPPPPRREGWVAEGKRKAKAKDAPKAKAKGRPTRAEPDEEEFQAERPRERPPITPEAWEILDGLAMFPLIIAQQVFETPTRPMKFHNEGIRQVQKAVRNYVKMKYDAMEWDGLSEEGMVLAMYGIAIGGAYMAGERKASEARQADAEKRAQPKGGPKQTKADAVDMEPNERGTYTPVKIVRG